MQASATAYQSPINSIVQAVISANVNPGECIEVRRSSTTQITTIAAEYTVHMTGGVVVKFPGPVSLFGAVEQKTKWLVPIKKLLLLAKVEAATSEFSL